MQSKYFNAHAHCFTIKHVPERFFDALTWNCHILSIKKIESNWIIRNLVRLIASAPVRVLVGIFSQDAKKQLKRLHGLIKYGLKESQFQIFDTMRTFYPEDFRLVMLSMDMEYMMTGLSEKGDPQKDFLTQVTELKHYKQLPEYKDKIFPFIFADPRRDNITGLVKEYLMDTDAPFQGIKLYPALGYYPFDYKLKEIYEFALLHNVPIITHCIQGDVYCRKIDGFSDTHPIAGYPTRPTSAYKKPSNFQMNFTHPLNYECLLNPEHASKIFGEGIDFRKLKICLAHAGGGEEWGLHRKQVKSGKEKVASDTLSLGQKWLGNTDERNNWLEIIKALMDKYDNLYIDISFTLHSKDIYDTLKELLNHDRYQNRILFGTDYYVVATESEEPDLLKLLYRELDSAHLRKICYENPIRFLSSNLNQVN